MKRPNVYEWQTEKDVDEINAYINHLESEGRRLEKGWRNMIPFKVCTMERLDDGSYHGYIVPMKGDMLTFEAPTQGEVEMEMGIAILGYLENRG